MPRPLDPLQLHHPTTSIFLPFPDFALDARAVGNAADQQRGECQCPSVITVKSEEAWRTHVQQNRRWRAS